MTSDGPPVDYGLPNPGNSPRDASPIAPMPPPSRTEGTQVPNPASVAANGPASDPVDRLLGADPTHSNEDPLERLDRIARGGQAASPKETRAESSSSETSSKTSPRSPIEDTLADASIDPRSDVPKRGGVYNRKGMTEQEVAKVDIFWDEIIDGNGGIENFRPYLNNPKYPELTDYVLRVYDKQRKSQEQQKQQPAKTQAETPIVEPEVIAPSAKVEQAEPAVKAEAAADVAAQAESTVVDDGGEPIDGADTDTDDKTAPDAGATKPAGEPEDQKAIEPEPIRLKQGGKPVIEQMQAEIVKSPDSEQRFLLNPTDLISYAQTLKFTSGDRTGEMKNVKVSMNEKGQWTVKGEIHVPVARFFTAKSGFSVVVGNAEEGGVAVLDSKVNGNKEINKEVEPLLKKFPDLLAGRMKDELEGVESLAFTGIGEDGLLVNSKKSPK